MADAADVPSIAAGEDNSEEPQARNQTDNGQSVATEGVQTPDSWVADFQSSELRDKVRTRGFKSPEAIAKSYFELDSKAGAPFNMPRPNAPPEVWDRFRAEVQKLYRPESPDEYELDSAVLPEGVELKASAESEFRTIAYNLGLDKDQARSLYKQTVSGLIDYVLAQRRRLEDQRRDGVQKLRKDWTAEHYDENLATVRDAIRKYGDDELIQYMNTGPGNEPAVLRFIYNMARQMAEEPLVEGEVIPAGQEPASARRIFDRSPEMTGNNRVARLG